MKTEQGQGQVQHHRQVGTVVQRREAMPTVAAFIDLCRVACGSEMVDQQMAVALQARREYVQVLATKGEAAAARWRLANAHHCTFFASEGGRTVGMASPWGATPPIGTPTATTRGGNSAPAPAPVAGLGKSPSNSPKVAG